MRGQLEIGFARQIGDASYLGDPAAPTGVRLHDVDGFTFNQFAKSLHAEFVFPRRNLAVPGRRS